MTADAARLGRRNRRYGADTERLFINWLRAMGWKDARRRFAGDGRQGGDVDGLGVYVEVKGTAKAHPERWLRHAERENDGGPVYVVWKPPGNRNPATWIVYTLRDGGVRMTYVRNLWGPLP